MIAEMLHGQSQLSLMGACWNDRSLWMEARIHDYLRCVASGATDHLPPWRSRFTEGEMVRLAEHEEEDVARARASGTLEYWHRLRSCSAEFTLLEPGATFVYRQGERLFRWDSGHEHAPWERDAC